MKDMALLVADLYEAAGALRAAGEGIAATQGQTQARWQVLSVISAEALPVPRAARRLGVSRQNVQRIANELTSDGLTEWLTNPDHRSSPLLALTPSGAAALTAITAHAVSFNNAIGRGISAAEIAAMRELVGRLIRNIGSVAGSPQLV
jgi:DNA-binding MarR family transcriptional regulator